MTPDRTLWFVTSIEDGNAAVCTSEQQAFDCWVMNPRDTVIETNPFENWSRYVHDEFAERLEGEEIAARSWRAHERSFAVGRM
jgi:hypothetical protein